MIGLDTNVLVRYIVRDDEKQTEEAARIIESQCTMRKPGLISIVVLCELAWVLSRGYKLNRDTISTILQSILSVEELRVQMAEIAWLALDHYKNGKADFPDYVIGVSNRKGKAKVTCTFDKKAAESDLFQLIQ